MCIHCNLVGYLGGRWGQKQDLTSLFSLLNVCKPLSELQVNIGILISVTRIISRISGESYKVHGDANAVKWVILFSWSDQRSFDIVLLTLKANNMNTVYCFVSRLTVKAVAVLLPILGISWIFGVLAINSHSLPFLYIFAVFNSLQVSSLVLDLLFSKMFAIFQNVCHYIWELYLCFLFFLRGSLSSCFTVFSTRRYDASCNRRMFKCLEVQSLHNIIYN